MHAAGPEEAWRCALALTRRATWDSLLPISSPAVLHMAAGKGQRSMVEFLIQRGAALEAPAGPGRWTPLHEAAHGGACAAAEALLDAGGWSAWPHRLWHKQRMLAACMLSRTKGWPLAGRAGVACSTIR